MVYEPKEWGTYIWDPELSMDANLLAAKEAGALIEAADLQNIEEALLEQSVAIDSLTDANPSILEAFARGEQVVVTMTAPGVVALNPVTKLKSKRSDGETPVISAEVSSVTTPTGANIVELASVGEPMERYAARQVMVNDTTTTIVEQVVVTGDPSPTTKVYPSRVMNVMRTADGSNDVMAVRHTHAGLFAEQNSNPYVGQDPSSLMTRAAVLELVGGSDIPIAYWDNLHNYINPDYVGGPPGTILEIRSDSSTTDPIGYAMVSTTGLMALTDSYAIGVDATKASTGLVNFSAPPRTWRDSSGSYVLNYDTYTDVYSFVIHDGYVDPSATEVTDQTSSNFLLVIRSGVYNLIGRFDKDTSFTDPIPDPVVIARFDSDSIYKPITNPIWFDLYNADGRIDGVYGRCVFWPERMDVSIVGTLPAHCTFNVTWVAR